MYIIHMLVILLGDGYGERRKRRKGEEERKGRGEEEFISSRWVENVSKHGFF